MAKGSSIGPGEVLNAVLVGATLYGGYQVWRAFNPPGDEGQGGGNNTDPRTPSGTVVPEVAQRATITREAARILADRIYAAIYGDGSFWDGAIAEDEEEVIAAMIVPRNDADVLLIVDAYGERGGAFWTTGTYTLPAALVHYLSAADRARINMVYAHAGINMRV